MREKDIKESQRREEREKKIKITIPSFWHISISASYQLEREGKDRE